MGPRERILKVQLLQKLNENPGFAKELGVTGKLKMKKEFKHKEKESTNYVKEFK